ncbi:MAG: ABC transporter permease [Cytophagales bacterium]|nr:ABC transporter permease [Cytophagales bacterium]
MSKTPPKFPFRLFRLYCDPDIVDDIEGDLLERFERHYQHRKFAKWLLAKDVLLLFRPGIIRSFEGYQQLNYYGMFKNNVKMAFRSFRREKAFTAINVIGLTFGLWCALMTMIWIQDELKFDRFHASGDQLHRLLMNFEWQGEMHTEEASAYPTGDVFKEQLPEVLERTRYNFPERFTLVLNEETRESNVAAADPNFFELFSFPVIEGNPSSCLDQPQNVVISKAIADNHFPGKSAIGQTIIMQEGVHEISFTVTAVVDVPYHSSMQFDAMIPLEVILSFQNGYDNWGNTYFATYLKLAPGSNMEAFHAKANEIAVANDAWYTLMAQPFQDQRLYDSFQNGAPSGGKINTLIMFALVALCSILIASFNYINLATAKALRRTREIGLRKIIGANKSNLIWQFLIESSILVIMASFLALVLCSVSIPFFNALVYKQITIDFSDPMIYLFLGVMFVLTVVLSGIYPAVFLASFNPFNALKNLMPKKGFQPILRKALVGFQFTISIVLVSAAFVVSQQMKYFTSKELGFDKEQIVYLELDQSTFDKYEVIKSKLLAHSGVAGVASSNHDFVGAGIGFTSDVRWRLLDAEEQIFFGIQEVDAGFASLTGMELVSGRYFNTELSDGSREFLINETAVKAMGFENPIGERLSFWDRQGEIVGVVKDFHVTTLHDKIQPVILMNKPNGTYVFVKAKPNQLNEVVDHLIDVHEELSGFPIQYNFLDRRIANSYEQEMTLQKLTSYSSMLALMISLLGLFGLATYACQRRMKEIGIRKVLGSDTWQLIVLLTKDFTMIIVLALLVGAPIAYFSVNDWLENFAYRINISWWPFALSGLLAMILTWLIVGSQTMRAASVNPVRSLRDE